MNTPPVALMVTSPASPPPLRRTTSGKGPRREPRVWGAEVRALCDAVDIFCAGAVNERAPGKPYLCRLSARDDSGEVVGGVAVLTLYASGSWTWGGDADVVAYAREPLDRHGVLP